MGIEQLHACWIVKCDKCGEAIGSGLGDVDELHYPSEKSATEEADGAGYRETVKHGLLCDECLFVVQPTEVNA